MPLLKRLPEPPAHGHPPSLPDGVRIYAVGDIHARVDLLAILLERIASDIALRPAVRPICIFLGDYIDRGPSARATIDALIKHGRTHESVFLRGNHESIALKCLISKGQLDQWLRLGGLETLASYGLSADLLAQRRRIVEIQAAFHNALPQEHLRFFRDLSNSFTCGDYFFAHAGVKPDIELSLQTENDLLWIRDEFLLSTVNHGKVVVHGHTPIRDVEVRSNRINIDTGAFATGRLTCLVIEGPMLSTIETSPDDH